MRKYEHGGDVYKKNVRLDFSVNTNPLGMSEAVKSAVSESISDFGSYPDNECRTLRAAIAEYEGVNVDNILCSNGASEMIFAIVRAVMPKKAVLIAPTFSEYERALMSVGCETSYYKLSEDNGFCIGRDFLNSLDGADITFICNPNNPVGSVAHKSLMEDIAQKCRSAGVVCVSDECFADLAGCYSMKGKMSVIKAFTKTYSLAGLRLGYLIGDDKIIADTKLQLPAWNVSKVAQAAGAAALSDKDYLKKSIEIIEKERGFLQHGLTALGFKVFDSQANFILFKGREGIAQELLKKGIMIRDCSNFEGLSEGFYRIGVKLHAENEELIKELGEICG